MSVCIAAPHSEWSATVFDVSTRRIASVQVYDGGSPDCWNGPLTFAGSAQYQPMAAKGHLGMGKIVDDEPAIKDMLNRCADRFVSALFTYAIHDEMDDRIFDIEYDHDGSDDDMSLMSDACEDVEEEGAEEEDEASLKAEEVRLEARKVLMEATRHGRLDQVLKARPQQQRLAASEAVAPAALRGVDEDVCSIASEDDLADERVLAEQAMKVIRSAVEASMAGEFPDEGPGELIRNEAWAVEMLQEEPAKAPEEPAAVAAKDMPASDAENAHLVPEADDNGLATGKGESAHKFMEEPALRSEQGARDLEGARAGGVGEAATVLEEPKVIAAAGPAAT
eukprot:CAMPEP_0179263774 /NCGR_PEP_ID=MMETSP0797-20121207/28051_1 /TAXON_ID=47934 /ORGANISM="Dinophysis acuminata, Strain DAEP01" /LENGTH=336 /DNA_ID=CAMNT_0020971941 /DNA_START=83 /DNA_END=1088 /DNA_ORIENTATION=+